ncbi:DNA-binding SARP family transcriptional activator [Longimicrobium terrae]|nr:DNA-binding SARP family transcriptional activator [Longimicrobium terrae]
MFLHTFGHPVLYGAGGIIVTGLRRKDMALLVFLSVEGVATHARTRLAALLWGENREERARHSLTQALGRLGRVLSPGVLSMDRENVRWAGGLPCDAHALLAAAAANSDDAEPAVAYTAHFLEGFDPGVGAEDFNEWADRRRADLRNAALRVLERAGAQAEAAGEWERALRLGERAVAIDPVWERGHRRILRALAAGGERNRGLRHYQQLEAWLEAEFGGQPDPDTRALAAHLRALEPGGGTAPLPVPPAQPPAMPVSVSINVAPNAAVVAEAAADSAPAEPKPEAVSPLASAHAAPPVADTGSMPAPEAEISRTEDVRAAPPAVPDRGESEAPSASPSDGERTADEGSSARDDPPRTGRWTAWRKWLRAGVFIVLKLLLIAALVAVLLQRAASRAREPRPGERLLHQGRSYIVLDRTLLGYPDPPIARVCSGGPGSVGRRVAILPRPARGGPLPRLGDERRTGPAHSAPAPFRHPHPLLGRVLALVRFPRLLLRAAAADAVRQADRRGDPQDDRGPQRQRFALGDHPDQQQNGAHEEQAHLPLQKRVRLRAPRPVHQPRSRNRATPAFMSSVIRATTFTSTPARRAASKPIPSLW